VERNSRSIFEWWDATDDLLGSASGTMRSLDDGPNDRSVVKVHHPAPIWEDTMTKCDACKDEINHGESHLGPPFIEGVRHMRCPPKCKNCGKKFLNERYLKEHKCQ